MRSRLCLFLSILLVSGVSAQHSTIIPQPTSLEWKTGKFSLSKSTLLVIRNGVDNSAADFLNNYLKLYYGFTLRKVKEAKSGYIQLTTLQTLVPGKEGAYSLNVTPTSIVIQGQTASGTFYGMQTLIQLLPVQSQGNNAPLPIAALSVSDAPRFAYRGMHLDAARHFFPVSFIKKYIDYLALHKFNTFHWHLTDDQGWRIEIKKYPKLTTIGAQRNGTIIGRYPGKGSDNEKYGGFYTQAQVKEVVKYAKDRFIDVIPEIEMPGHASAAIAAYPELSCFPEKPTAIPANMISSRSVAEQKAGRIKLVQETWGVFDDVFCAGKENTFTFLQNVLDEVITLFPSKYLHVGGDECPKTNWKQCPLCQQRMKENGLKNEHELQSYFIQRMEKYLNSKGKTLIGWDEILEGGLAPKAVVMSWRGEEGGIAAAKQKHDVIMTPGNPVYFDHTQSANEDSVTIGGFNPIEKVYAYEPIAKELSADDAKYILGAQANLWTEYITNPRKVEYMIFPRMAALSEVLWSPKEKRDWSDFETRLQVQFKRYDKWKTNYSKAFFDLKTSVIPTDDYNGVLWKAETKRDNTDIFYIEKRDIPKPIKYTSPLLVTASGVKTIIQRLEGQTISSLSQKFSFNLATGKKIIVVPEPSKKYPGDGAFTLVDGVQNEKGLNRSKEFLGFEGTDCEATIDLGKETEIKEVIIHTFEQQGSWIYAPKGMDISASTDGEHFSPLIVNRSFPNNVTDKTKSVIQLDKPVKTRYLKLLIRNFGVIPEGMGGAGNRAWLFVDEIEVN